MDVFTVLLLASISVVFMQTCREFQVQEKTQTNKYAKKHRISCLLELTLEQCALECLLVTICKSINHIFDTTEKSSMCELLVDEFEEGFKDYNGSSYVDIRDWSQDVAGTCATRPCADSQRCIPTNPYRCMNIDCGVPPVIPFYDMNTDMSTNYTDTVIGSRAYYKCRDANKATVIVYNTVHWCFFYYSRICNSDSSWTTQDMYCQEKPEQ